MNILISNLRKAQEDFNERTLVFIKNNSITIDECIRKREPLPETIKTVLVQNASIEIQLSNLIANVSLIIDNRL